MKKKHFNVGENNGRYIDGRTLKKYYCLDCKKEISHYPAQRCDSCARKNRKGKNHWNYKEGLPYCIDCGKELSNYKNKRCYSCEAKRKHREGICNCKGINNNRFGKRLKPNFIKYKNIWMRSSWEVIYAKWLDERNIVWEYEKHTFNLGNTTYTPDFYLPRSNEYVEIKGYETKIFKKKIRLFKKIYNNINIKIIKSIKRYE